MPRETANLSAFSDCLNSARSSAIQQVTEEFGKFGERRIRARWSGALSAMPGASEFLKPRAPVAYIVDVVKDMVLDRLTSSESTSTEVLGWVLKGGTVILAASEATPIGAAILLAFFTRDALLAEAQAVEDHAYNATVQRLGIDVGLVNLTNGARKAREAVDAALKRNNLQEIRSGGEEGRHFRQALADLFKVPPPNFSFALGVFRWQALHYYQRRIERISDAMLELAVLAFTARAWSNAMQRLSDKSDDAAATGGSAGGVDLHHRHKIFVSYAILLRRLSDECAARVASLSEEFVHATDWKAWYGG